MADEPVPNDQYGLPVREIAWDSTPCRLYYQRRIDGDREIYLLIIDTVDNRNVTAWSREQLEGVLRTGLAFLGVIPDGLMLADLADLQGGTND